MKKGMNLPKSPRRLHIALAGVGLLAGCSSRTTQPAAGLPPAPSPSNVTAYIGTQSPGYWTLNVDSTQNVFSYQPQTGSAAVSSGGFAASNGVLDFGNANGTSLGKAVAQPAGAALLRPGGPASYPVAMVQQSDCVPVTGKLRYIYAGLLGQVIGSTSISSPGYGTFVASSSSDGKSYAFTDVHNYALPQFDFVGNKSLVSPGRENGKDPSAFSATCSSSGGTGSVASDSNPAFPSGSNGTPSTPSFNFNPAGAMVQDRGRGTDSSSTGWVGFVEAQVAIKASDVAAGVYRGFVYEATDLTPMDTRPVAFAQPVAGGPILSGGAFPNDDLTQTPGTEYTITLGKQDSVLNGVFPNALFTAIDDGNCAQYLAGVGVGPQLGIDGNGKPTCTNSAVAVVGQVGGKYVIYVTSIDQTRPSPFTEHNAYLIQFYLYQQ